MKEQRRAAPILRIIMLLVAYLQCTQHVLSAVSEALRIAWGEVVDGPVARRAHGP